MQMNVQICAVGTSLIYFQACLRLCYLQQRTLDILCSFSNLRFQISRSGLRLFLARPALQAGYPDAAWIQGLPE